MFRLLRYFSLASLVSVAMITALLAFFYRQVALNDLVETGERHNVALTRALANSLWPEVGSFLASTTKLSDDALRGHTDIGKIRQSLSQSVKGLSVLKIKIYDLNGRTVFSSEAKQIGESKSKNAGFIAARSGIPASEITHRDSFSAFEGVIEDRDLISSYIPVRADGAGGKIEGVFELYYDVTDLFDKMERTQSKLIGGVVLLLGLLYGVLFLIVRHAEKLLQGQEAKRKLAEQALAEKAQDLQRSNSDLEQFAYVASHDLQEPLRMISSYAQLLAKRYKGKMDGDADDYFGFMVDGANRMQALIADLLVYARVDSRAKEKQPTDCNAVLDRVRRDLTMAIQESGAIVTIDPLPTIEADETQLAQLFQNLVGNAIKFRNGNAPEVRVSFEAQANDWLFAVKDNGIGIDPQFRERVFAIFQRLHTQADYSGTGIGLAVCKKIVERHGGKIWLESEVGKGTTFLFTVPRKLGSEMPATPNMGLK
jgi:signal transduction histidine kinase